MRTHRRTNDLVAWFILLIELKQLYLASNTLYLGDWTQGRLVAKTSTYVPI